MHGSTTGLESADTSGESPPRLVRSGEDAQQLVLDTEAAEEIADQLEACGEYKAAREVFDAVARQVGQSPLATGQLREGQRGSEASHGEAASDAQVDAFK